MQHMLLEQYFISKCLSKSLQLLSYPDFCSVTYIVEPDWSPCCTQQEEPAILICTLLIYMRCMYVASIRLNFHYKEWVEWTKCNNLIMCFLTFYLCNLITCVLIICHVKLTQSTALEQKRFDLRSFSPTLPNFWLLLVTIFFYSSREPWWRQILICWELPWSSH